VEIENPVLTEFIKLEHMDPDSWKTGTMASAVQSVPFYMKWAQWESGEGCCIE